MSINLERLITCHTEISVLSSNFCLHRQGRRTQLSSLYRLVHTLKFYYKMPSFTKSTIVPANDGDGFMLDLSGTALGLRTGCTFITVTGDGSAADPYRIAAQDGEFLAVHLGLMAPAGGAKRLMEWGVSDIQLSTLWDAVQDVGTAEKPEKLDLAKPLHPGAFYSELVRRRDVVAAKPSSAGALLVDQAGMEAVQRGTEYRSVPRAIREALTWDRGGVADPHGGSLLAARPRPAPARPRPPGDFLCFPILP